MQQRARKLCRHFNPVLADDGDFLPSPALPVTLPSEPLPECFSQIGGIELLKGHFSHHFKAGITEYLFGTGVENNYLTLFVGCHNPVIGTSNELVLEIGFSFHFADGDLAHVFKVGGIGLQFVPNTNLFLGSFDCNPERLITNGLVDKIGSPVA